MLFQENDIVICKKVGIKDENNNLYRFTFKKVYVIESLIENKYVVIDDNGVRQEIPKTIVSRIFREFEVEELLELFERELSEIMDVFKRKYMEYIGDPTSIPDDKIYKDLKDNKECTEIDGQEFVGIPGVIIDISNLKAGINVEASKKAFDLNVLKSVKKKLKIE